MNEYVPFHHKIVRGGLWMGFGFAGQQGIAVLRTLVLARLLTPEDFGLVGLVVLTQFAGLMLTDFGVESALIQRAELPQRFMHTAWSLMLMRAVFLFLLLQLIAPWIAAVFHRPDAENLLRVGALSFPLVSLPVVSEVLLLRELRYRCRVLLDACRIISGTVFAIALALWLGNGWALLMGLLLGQTVAMVWVWFLHSYRPRWVLDREALFAFWNFGRHLYLSRSLAYLVNRGDGIVVGKLQGMGNLGQYQVVCGIAEMLTRGLSEVVTKVVFPAYARIVAEGRSLVDAFDDVWRILSFLLLPIAAILLVFPKPIISMLLGEQWLPASIAFAVLAAAQTLRAFAAACGSLILAAGRTSYLSRIKLVEAICFVILIVPMTARWGLAGAAGCLVVVYSLSLAGHVYGAQQIAPVAIRMLRSFWEPMLVTLLFASLAWHLCPSGELFAAICIVLWAVMWMCYLMLRHAGLLHKIWAATHGGFSISQPLEEPRI